MCELRLTRKQPKKASSIFGPHEIVWHLIKGESFSQLLSGPLGRHSNLLPRFHRIFDNVQCLITEGIQALAYAVLRVHPEFGGIGIAHGMQNPLGGEREASPLDN